MAAPPSTPQKEKPFVLVAEDDPVLLRMMARMMEPIATVQTANDGMDAYAYLKSGQKLPALVVTDVMMPRMDGLTLVKKMKAEPDLARIPVIMLTAKSSPKDVIGGINAGARHYVTKPFKQDDLLSKVKKTLGL